MTDDPKKTTHKGFASPDDTQPSGNLPLPPNQAKDGRGTLKDAPVRRSSMPLPTPHGSPDSAQNPLPGIEVECAVETGSKKHRLAEPWRAYEIWTRNRIYYLNSALKCVSVVNRASGQHDPKNELLNSRLLGGHVIDPNGIVKEVSYPLPREGAAAVFGRAVGTRMSLSKTSPVLRVVMRVRVVRLDGTENTPTWEDISGEHGLT